MGSIGRRTIDWNAGSLYLCIAVQDDGTPCIQYLGPSTRKRPSSSLTKVTSSDLSLNTVRSVGEGNTATKTSKSLIGGYLSSRLLYTTHKEYGREDWKVLEITSRDAHLGIEICHYFEACAGVPVLRSYARITNVSSTNVPINQLSSLVIGSLTMGTKNWWSEYTLLDARNGWFREAQWREKSLPDAGIDEVGLYSLGEHKASQGIYTLSSRGSFSTGTFLPMGALCRKDDKDTWLWQIEHNGSWRWEVGDYCNDLYLAAGGPTWSDHAWRQELQPGQSFTSIPVACCHVDGSFDYAMQTMTQYRRLIRRQHPDHDHMPIIFNDYMNCLMGDPDEDKIQALLEPVARTGAEYFVIDAGWYADDGNWWDDVGLWEPSRKRFPSGFKKLMDNIRSHGLTPGLWIEPEVVGIRSVVAKQLPEESFFQEGGKRMVERGRYHLDYRSNDVRTRMTNVIRRLVTEYGIGYFKFDYNIEMISGSDAGDINTGEAHIGHQRAYLAWVGELLDEFPQLVIENCSSGAQRMDYAMLSVHTLQSTSDQQDPVLYAPIAAAAPTAVTPEQSATWAYPQPAWSDEINAMTVVNSLLGRIHLSGKLDGLSPHQYDLVSQGMQVYKRIRADLKSALPFWPLGLPKWHDDWIALGMETDSGRLLLSVWRRGGPTTCEIPLPTILSKADVVVSVLYPAKFEVETVLRRQSLEITLSNTPCARLFAISTTNHS